MSRRFEDGVITPGIEFGLGIASFGWLTLAGSKNWIELLCTMKSTTKKRKLSKEENWVHLPDKTALNTQKIDEKATEVILESTVEKEVMRRPKAHSLPYDFVTTKPRIPKIKIIRASDENIPCLYCESSDSDSDIDDCEDFVYECPGLAPAGEDMTVENPLFNEKLFRQSYRTPELPRKFWKDVFTGSI